MRVEAERFDRTLPGLEVKGDWIPFPDHLRHSNKHAHDCYVVTNETAVRHGCTEELAQARQDIRARRLYMNYERERAELELLSSRSYLKQVAEDWRDFLAIRTNDFRR